MGAEYDTIRVFPSSGKMNPDLAGDLLASGGEPPPEAVRNETGRLGVEIHSAKGTGEAFARNLLENHPELEVELNGAKVVPAAPGNAADRVRQKADELGKAALCNAGYKQFCP